MNPFKELHAPSRARLLVAGIVCVWTLAAGVGAGTADAGEVTVRSSFPGDPGALEFTADPGEANQVGIRLQAGFYEVVDDGAPLRAGAGCVAVDAGHARCADVGITQTAAWLLDGDDRLVNLAVPAPPPFPFGAVNFVSAGAGDDAIETGDANDDIEVGEGVDTVVAGGGDDFVRPGFGDVQGDRFDGGPGNDQLSSSSGGDMLTGGPGDDSLAGGAGDDTLDAGPGADSLIAGDGQDLLVAGDGDDFFVDGEAGDDVVRAGRGDDNAFGGSGNDLVDAGAGDDHLDPPRDPNYPDPAVAGSDVLDAGPGDDTLHGDEVVVRDRAGVVLPSSAVSADVMRGGAGRDTADYSRRRASLNLSSGDGANDGEPGEGDDLSRDVEVILGGLDADRLAGGGGADTLDGRSGDDLVIGGGGDDVLEGGVNDGGSDSMDGGDGADRLSGGAGDDHMDGGAGADVAAGAGGGDTILGGPGDDELSGGSGGDTVNGEAGDDSLYGGARNLIGADGADALDGGEGADALSAGAGSDRLAGGPGPDLLSGEDGTDTADYGDSAGGVVVTFDDLANDGEAGEGDNVARDLEAVVGGGAADTLAGDARPNALDGGSGQDYVEGGAGRDPLEGGGGRDAIRSRDGIRDVVSCGDAVDFAIADRLDVLRDCERVDRGGARARLGRRLLVRPRGTGAAMRLPRTSRFIPLRERLAVPRRSVIDPGRRQVVVTGARRGGGRHVGRFWGGRFSVDQSRRSARGVTVLGLRGGDFSACGARSSSSRSLKAQPRRIRGTWGKVRRGRFRTRGRHSAAGVRGTEWLVEDRCDGTYTYVRRGTVVVRDFGLRRTLVLHSGESYLARPRESSRRTAPRGG